MSVRVLDYSLSPFAEEHFAISTSLGGAGETGYLLSFGNWGGSGVTWTESPIQDPDGGYQAWTASKPTGTLNFEVSIATPSLAAYYNLVSDPSWRTGQEWTVSWFVHADSMVTANYYRFAVYLWDGYAASRENVRLSYYPSFPENPLGFTSATSGGPGYTISNSVRLEDYGDSWWKISVRIRDYSGTCTRMVIGAVWSSGAGSYTLYRPELRAGNHIQGAPLALSVIEDAERQDLLSGAGYDITDATVNNGTLALDAIAAPDGTLTAYSYTANSTSGVLHRATLPSITPANLGDKWHDGSAWNYRIWVYAPSIGSYAPLRLYWRVLGATNHTMIADFNASMGIQAFSGTTTGGPALSAERNVSVKAIGNSGWHQVDLTLFDYEVNATSVYWNLPYYASYTQPDWEYVFWNPTLRYGDWVARGKNWQGTPLIDWAITAGASKAYSATAAPDGTLSAVQTSLPAGGNCDISATNAIAAAVPAYASVTLEAYINHSDGDWDSGRIYHYLRSSSAFPEMVYIDIDPAGGFAASLVTLATSGPGYTTAEHAEATQIGTNGWWRYRLTITDYGGTALTTWNYLRAANSAGATRGVFWGPRITVGNPADARGYFVSGPQNLLGDGSDYDPATSNWTSPYPPTLTANSEVAPNGRLEADTLEHYNSPGASYLSFTSSSVVIGSATYYNFYYKVDPTITSNIETVTYKILGPGSVLRESIVLTLNYGSATPVSVLTSTTTGGPGYTASDVEVSEVSNDWVRISIRLFDYSADALYYQVLHYRLTTGVPFTLWGSEITTIERASFTPPSLGEVTTFGSPISYSWAKLRLRRGTDGDRATLIGMPVAGEPIYCTDTKTLFIGDGTTRGGSPAVKPPTVVQLTTSLTTNINNATTDNLVEWDTQDVLWGDDISHDTVTNSGRITIDTDGIYEIACTVRVNATGTSASHYNGIMRCRKNGTTDFGPSSAGGYISYSHANDESSFHIPGFVYQFSAGDYFEILIDRESSQGRGVYLTANKSFLYIKRIA
jgi:hypothetical protein